LPVDLFDVATHDSRHAPALSVDAALTLIEQRSGSQFDPELAKLFVGVVNDLRAQPGEAHLDEILSIDARESAMSRIRARIRR
jgi:HD-GYP domain-containing protein (c-di-GMP phosphodiesterase class II)